MNALHIFGRKEIAISRNPLTNLHLFFFFNHYEKHNPQIMLIVMSNDLRKTKIPSSVSYNLALVVGQGGKGSYINMEGAMEHARGPTHTQQFLCVCIFLRTNLMVVKLLLINFTS